MGGSAGLGGKSPLRVYPPFTPGYQKHFSRGTLVVPRCRKLASDTVKGFFFLGQNGLFMLSCTLFSLFFFSILKGVSTLLKVPYFEQGGKEVADRTPRDHKGPP